MNVLHKWYWIPRPALICSTTKNSKTIKFGELTFVQCFDPTRWNKDKNFQHIPNLVHSPTGNWTNTPLPLPRWTKAVRSPLQWVPDSYHTILIPHIDVHVNCSLKWQNLNYYYVHHISYLVRPTPHAHFPTSTHSSTGGGKGLGTRQQLSLSTEGTKILTLGNLKPVLN